MDIIVFYFVYLHLFIFTIAFFILDKLYLKGKSNYFFILILLGCSMYLGYQNSEIDSLFLLVTFFFLSIKNSDKKNVVHSLLVVCTAYLVEKPFYKGLRPFILLDFQSKGKLLFICILIMTFIYGIGVAWCIRKWLFPKIYQKGLETVLAYSLLLGILIEQAFWLISNYAEGIPSLKGIILVFYIIMLAFVISTVQIFSKNQKLKYQAKERQLEYDMMTKHAEEVKKQYQEMRQFRHDYINILSTIEYYLEQEDMTELKSFYQSTIKPTKRLFQTNMLRLDELQKIESVEIRSILSSKLMTAQEKGIDVQVEIDETITKDIAVDSIILIRIIGIILDNAIEELEQLGQGKLIVGLFYINNNLTFVIQNSTRDAIEPLHVLKQSGYSTKGAGRGLGLSIIDELILLEPKLLVETRITEDYFVQKIMITGGIA